MYHMHKTFLKLLGLSLIEILITITIVAILCTVSIYSYKDYKTTSMYNNALARIEQSKLKISDYYIKHQKCPKNDFVAITETANSSSIWARISNEDCSITMFDKTNDGILSFQATKVSSFGELLYYCTYFTGKEAVKEHIPQCLAPNTDPYISIGTPVNKS